ncbi:hypothetical protein PIROE2DRAFT_14257 [Piromyces sp. E2]|nr:hypothetical protein PIROE2DRAFT_14257 [Piromyces sp. E2]|eukprot:OUM60065.1 hypothetical protein PIROE2DRAFT_14257 [Piromyces sp. E2]
MITESQLIQYIDDNSIEKIRTYFQENNVTSKYFNNFNQTLLHLVKNNASFEIIEFIVEQQYDKSNIEPLFYSIDCENYEVATVLLDSDANIKGKIFDERTPHDYCNVLEYIRDTLTEDKFDFIFKHKGKTDLVSSRFICYIIINSVKGKFYYERNGFDILRYILNYKYADHDKEERNLFIINTFFLKHYKNGYSLTNAQISQLVVEFEKHVTLSFNNNKNKWNIHPVDLAVSVNNRKLVELLLDYANKHHILLDLNHKRKKGIYPLLDTMRNGNEDILRSIFHYANEHQIILNVNDSDIYGNRPFEVSLKNNDDYMVECFLQYVDDHHINIDIEESISLLNEHNVHVLNILIDYADKHSIVLNMNTKNSEGKFPLLSACACRYSGYYIDSLFEHVNRHSILLNINDKDDDGNYPLLNATKYGNGDMVNYLFRYADEHQLMITLNDKNKEGNYPLLNAAKFGDINVVKKENRYGEYPIGCAIMHRHGHEIVKMIKDYGKSKGIPINVP